MGLYLTIDGIIKDILLKLTLTNKYEKNLSIVMVISDSNLSHVPVSVSDWSPISSDGETVHKI